MTDLAGFLLARIAEDEAVAQEALARASVYGDREVSWKWLRSTGGSTMWEPTNHDPARVLAECEAKRRIVGRHSAAERYAATKGVTTEYAEGYDHGILDAARFLALPYVDHKDYREAWRP